VVTGLPSNNENKVSSPGDAMTVSQPDCYSRCGFTQTDASPPQLLSII
jgi:hypothetical protein